MLMFTSVRNLFKMPRLIIKISNRDKYITIIELKKKNFGISALNAYQWNSSYQILNGFIQQSKI